MSARKVLRVFFVLEHTLTTVNDALENQTLPPQSRFLTQHVQCRLP